MEFPFGHTHHHHHHHHRRDDDEERQPNAPPPLGVNFAASPPPASYPPEPHFAAPPAPPYSQVSHVHHTSGDPYPPASHYGGYAPPPPPNPTMGSHGDYAEVSHVSHHHSHVPHMPSVFHHHPDEHRVPANLAGLAGRPTVKVYCKAETNYYLTIRDGKVILALANTADEAQHWYKDEKYSTRVKDDEGCPCFALVNKATGQAMKHSLGATHPVQLIPYDPDKLDASVLWTQSKDLGDGYRTIRMVNNTRLNVDAFHGDQKSGGVHDGTVIVLWDWNKGDNQRWKILPFCKFLLKLSAVSYLITFLTSQMLFLNEMGRSW